MTDETVYDGNNESQTTIDYDEEADNLSEGGGDGDGYDSQLVSLTQGKTTLRLLDDGEVTEFNYGTEENPDRQEKVVFDVEVVDGEVTYRDDGNEVTVGEGHDEDLSYAVTRASTESSQWGQLVRVGKDRGGLEGEDVTIVRTGTGTDTPVTFALYPSPSPRDSAWSLMSSSCLITIMVVIIPSMTV